MTDNCFAVRSDSSDLLVKLRYMEPSDTQALFCMENDPLNWSFSDGCDAPFTHVEIEQFVLGSARDLHSDGQLRFVIDLDGRVVGAVDLYNYDPTTNVAWVGVLVYPPSFRGGGIGRMALELLCERSVVDFALRGLYACVDCANHLSISLFECCGFLPCQDDVLDDDNLLTPKTKIYYRGLSH